MSRNRLLLVAALAVGLCVLGVIVALWARAGGSSSTSRTRLPIEARTVLSPSSALFGDTVTAVVEVTLDRSRVDPGSVRVVSNFAPWKPVGKPTRLRQDSKASTYLRTTFAVRCLDVSCLPSGNTALTTFLPVRVTYTPTGAAGSNARGSLNVPWPQLVLGSREVTTAGQRASATPWRGDPLSLPAVGYRMNPVLLAALLLAAAILLVVAGALLAKQALPRAAQPAVVRQPRALTLTPVEQAFVLLEDDGRVDGVADRRRALQLVSEMLFERGDLTLARTARALAWSEAAPEVGKTSSFAAHVRSALGEQRE